MSDFNVGDCVVCVDNGPSEYGLTAEELRIGGIYRVTGLHTAREGYRDAGKPGVLLGGVRSKGGSGSFGASRFRHLPKADEQFITEMRAIKPIRRSVEA